MDFSVQVGYAFQVARGKVNDGKGVELGEIVAAITQNANFQQVTIGLTVGVLRLVELGMFYPRLKLLEMIKACFKDFDLYAEILTIIQRQRTDFTRAAVEKVIGAVPTCPEDIVQNFFELTKKTSLKLEFPKGISGLLQNGLIAPGNFLTTHLMMVGANIPVPVARKSQAATPQ